MAGPAKPNSTPPGDRTPPATGDGRPYRLGIVIPARDEALRLPATLHAIAGALAHLPDVHLVRLLLADNGSRDGTADAATEANRELGLPLVLLPLAVAGKGATIRAAVPELARRAATDGDVDGILFMDADNATDLSELARFPRAGGLEIGDRRAPGAEIVPLAGRISPTRRLLTAGMRLANRLLLGLHERDTQCGFKLIDAAHAGLFARVEEDGWAFDAELILRAHRAGIPVISVPVRWVEQPGSKVRPIPDALRTVAATFRIRRRVAASGRPRSR